MREGIREGEMRTERETNKNRRSRTRAHANKYSPSSKSKNAKSDGELGGLCSYASEADSNDILGAERIDCCTQPQFLGEEAIDAKPGLFPQEPSFKIVDCVG